MGERESCTYCCFKLSLSLPYFSRSAVLFREFLGVWGKAAFPSQLRVFPMCVYIPVNHKTLHHRAVRASDDRPVTEQCIYIQNVSPSKCDCFILINKTPPPPPPPPTFLLTLYVPEPGEVVLIVRS